MEKRAYCRSRRKSTIGIGKLIGEDIRRRNSVSGSLLHEEAAEVVVEGEEQAYGKEVAVEEGPQLEL